MASGSARETRKPRRPAHLPGQRAPIACIPCRQRKIRCTSGWPSCKSCLKRSIDCQYAGISPGPSGQSTVDSVIRSPTSPCLQDGDPQPFSQVSTADLLQAGELFRDQFGSNLLFFSDPLTFPTSFSNKQLPRGLTLAVLALVTRVCSWGSVSESWRYYSTARELIQDAGDDVSLHTIQTHLILCVYEVGCGLESRAWIHLGNAIRMAQILRLPVMDKPPSPFDWGKPDQNGNDDLLARELKRRTFWSCFFLDKLLSNGRDRPSGIQEQDICCNLPVSEEDLLFRRFDQSLEFNDPKSWHSWKQNLYVPLIRILMILGDITTWHGRGGRHVDKRMPWKPGTPFTVLDGRLDEWEAQIPPHLKYSLNAFTALSMVNINQSKLWGLSYLFFFLAKASLHREYYPFVPQRHYAPCGVLFDPASTPNDWEQPPPGWREKSVRTLLRSSSSITELYDWMMKKTSPFPGMYPFMGLCLMTSTSVNMFFMSLDEANLEKCGSKAEIELSLNQGLKAMEDLKLYWDLPAYWINQLSLYCALLENSRDIEAPISRDSFRRVTDGIMNYLRETHGAESNRGRGAPSIEFAESENTLADADSLSIPLNFNPALFRSRYQYVTPGDYSPGTSQHRNAADSLATPTWHDKYPFQSNPFAPMLDELLEDQINSLANWEYFSVYGSENISNGMDLL